MHANASRSEIRLNAALQRIAAIAAVVTALLGALVLAGWAFDVEFLTSPLPSQASMKPLTALALLLGAVALWLRRQPAAGVWQHRLGLICAGAVAALGALILLEYLSGRNLGLDQLLFQQALLAENILPIGRPSPATAACLLLLGLALLALDSKPAWLSPAAALIALLVGALAVMGYAYEVTTLYQIGPYVPIALYTALAIVVLAVGLLAARPTGPIFGELTTHLAGSVLARRLLPAVVVVPFVLGWVRLYGQRVGLYDTGFGVALLVTGNIVVFAVLVLASARLLNQTDARREVAHAELREREERLRSLADATPNGLITVTPAGAIEWANRRAEALFGYQPGQLIGRQVDELVPRRFSSNHPSHRHDFFADPQAREMGAGRDLFGQRSNGSEFPVEIGLSPIETSRGDLTLASIIDITERKRAETALRQSEERFGKAFRSSPAALTVTRLADGQIVDVNDQFLQLLGYQRDEVIGHTSTELNMFPDPADRSVPVGRITAAGSVRNFEMVLLAKAGERRDVLFSTEQIELSGAAHALTILIDNSERKRAEEALRQLNAELETRVEQRTADLAASEAKFRTMFAVLPVGVSILDAQRRVVESNPALTRILRMSSEGLEIDPYANRQFIHSDGTPMRPQEFPSARVFQAQQPVFNVETGIVIETGETIWVAISGAPLPVAGFSAVMVTADLTERKRIEADLRQSEERFAQSFRSSATALTITRAADNFFIDVNDGFQSLFGYRREDVVGHPAPQLAINTDPEQRAEMMRQFHEHGSSHNNEMVVRTKSGELRNVLMSADAMQLAGEAHILTTMIDITTRKQAEAALLESEAKLRALFDVLPVGVSILDPDRRIVQSNPALARMMRLSEEGLAAGANASRGFIRPDGSRLPPEEYASTRAFEEQRLVPDVETGLVLETGETIWLDISAAPLPGEGLGVVAVSVDITERKQTQQALANERDQLQALMDNIPDTIYFKDRASRFTRVNLAQARVLGVATPQLAVGKSDADFQAAHLAAEFYAEEQRLLESGQPLIDRAEYNPTATGEARWLSATKVPLKDASGQVVGLVGISRDITGRIKAEEDLQRLNQQLANRVNELSLLNKFAEQLQACLTPEETYSLTAQIMSQLAPHQVGALFVVDADRTQLTTAASWGGPAPEQQVFDLDACWALRLGQLRLLDQAHPGVPCRHLMDTAPVASMCMPLLAQGQALGVLHLLAPDEASAQTFGEAIHQLARVVADSLALTWANLSLRESLRQQAIRDPLTGLFNRRFMEEALAREIRRAARSHQIVSLIMIDVDRFKRLNDRFGHETGDAVLRALGGLLLASSRGGDIACRYGGEEFLLILPEATVEIARQRAEQIGDNFRQMRFGPDHKSVGPATLSLGVAAYPQHGEVTEAVLRAADTALYRAKSEGRDRAVVAL